MTIKTARKTVDVPGFGEFEILDERPEMLVINGKLGVFALFVWESGAFEVRDLVSNDLELMGDDGGLIFS